jgi:hypothetical protein
MLKVLFTLRLLYLWPDPQHYLCYQNLKTPHYFNFTTEKKLKLSESRENPVLQTKLNFNILSIVHLNTIIVFFTNLMNKFFISLHLLHFSTCFKHYYDHPQEVKIALLQPLVSLLSLGDSSVHGLTCVLNSHLQRVTIPEALLIQFWPPEDEHNNARNI